MNPRFSVIIPLYNKAPYIKKALDSVCAQTYTDWECIIVDDGSTDGSAEVVRDYLGALEIENQRLRRISQPNTGVSVARNKGVKESRGEFVCFLDADDWWKPTFLEKMDKLISAYPDAGLYATNYIYYKPGKTHVALNLKTGHINYPKAYVQCFAMPVTSITACMPRKVFNEMGGFPDGIKLGEDFLLWAKTALHYPVAFSDKPLAYYNNDVPTALRATRNLHAPEHHMLFYLQPLEEGLANLQSSISNQQLADWHQLLDWLRINGLMDYWLSSEYHEAAEAELQKVDWSKQPQSVLLQYKTPIWLLKLCRRFMQMGSYCKQKLIKLFL